MKYYTEYLVTNAVVMLSHEQAIYISGLDDTTKKIDKSRKDVDRWKANHDTRIILHPMAAVDNEHDTRIILHSMTLSMPCKIGLTNDNRQPSAVIASSSPCPHIWIISAYSLVGNNFFCIFFVQVLSFCYFLNGFDNRVGTLLKIIKHQRQHLLNIILVLVLMWEANKDDHRRTVRKLLKMVFCHDTFVIENVEEGSHCIKYQLSVNKNGRRLPSTNPFRRYFIALEWIKAKAIRHLSLVNEM